MARRRTPEYVYVDDCACPYEVAPYIWLVGRRAGQRASSIYRGSDAAAMLHRKGKHTQAEIHRMYPSISNPEGQSQHDLHSDGYANAGPTGRRLEKWEVGIDSGTNSPYDKERIVRAAAHYGLEVRHPYSRGVEGHHWCFAREPRPNKRLRKLKVVAVRARLRLNR